MSISSINERMTGKLDDLWRPMHRYGVPLLRIALGVVFVWFGALKLTGSTPVAQLVADTLPFLPKGIVVPALGIFEVILGIALVLGRRLDLVVFLLVGHLIGTFLVLVVTPQKAFLNGDPLMLTMVGEFVVKNVVLIAAGLVVAAHYLDRRRA
jgi:putative oxidoreductase